MPNGDDEEGKKKKRRKKKNDIKSDKKLKKKSPKKRLKKIKSPKVRTERKKSENGWISVDTDDEEADMNLKDLIENHSNKQKEMSIIQNESKDDIVVKKVEPTTERTTALTNIEKQINITDELQQVAKLLT